MQLTALGWGLATMAFLVFKAIRALKNAVEVGFVDGIKAATTPIGSAIFTIFPPSFTPITPTVLRSFMEL